MGTINGSGLASIAKVKLLISIAAILLILALYYLAAIKELSFSYFSLGVIVILLVSAAIFIKISKK